MKKTRNINLDLIKVIACIGVVLLHTTMPGFKETGQWNYSSYLYYLGTYSISVRRCGGIRSDKPITLQVGWQFIEETFTA